MPAFSTTSSVLQPLNLPGFEGRLFIKRDDLIHPIVCGNKWRKLKYVVNAARKAEKTHLVTFGGAYSNHMVATACVGAAMGFKTSCFLRGDEPMNNHYIMASRLYGMEIIPVSREDYRHKDWLFAKYFSGADDVLFVQEGGESEEAILGMAEVVSELPFEPDWLVHASATATTARGLAKGILNSNWKTKVLSVAVLKNAAEQRKKTKGLNIVIEDSYDFGGYAKTSPELLQFMKTTVAQTGIMFDPVYTGKALYALNELKPEGKVVFVHTGGTMGMFSDTFLNAFSE
jgi:1-aminocyclopropane-1-carboxylate deaminase